MNQYTQFLSLHHQSSPFVLGNVWNAKSAKIAQEQGFNAIGTSSGAIADSLGYPDGEKIPFAEMLYIVKRIKSATDIPLTVDMERGYTDDTAQLNEYIQQLLDIGVVGINIEDAQGEQIYLRKLNGIRQYLEQTSQQLFINARTDVFLQKLDQPMETTLKRAELYRQAGADGLFVTGVQDVDVIHSIVNGTTLPVNVVATPKLFSVDILAQCGVKRISMAAFLYRATYKALDDFGRKVTTEHVFTHLHQ